MLLLCSCLCRYECIRVLLEHMFSSASSSTSNSSASSEVPTSTNTCADSAAAFGCNSNSTLSTILPLASSADDSSKSTSDANANTRGSEQQAGADATRREGTVADEQAQAATPTASSVCVKKAWAPASVSAGAEELLLSRRQSVFVNGFQVLFALLDLRKPLLDPTGGLGEMGLGRGEGFGLGAFTADLPSAVGGLPNGSGNQALIALEPAKVRALLHNVERALSPHFGSLCAVFDMQLSVSISYFAVLSHACICTSRPLMRFGSV